MTVAEGDIVDSALRGRERAKVERAVRARAEEARLEAERADDDRSRRCYQRESERHMAAAELHAKAASMQDEHVRHSEETALRRKDGAGEA